MQPIKLSCDEIELFIKALKKGYFFNNGLVGNLSLSYRDGMFKSIARDSREANDEYITTYNENSFRLYLKKKTFINFVYNALIEDLQKYQ